MAEKNFTQDDIKQKHGSLFEEAASVFDDERTLFSYDDQDINFDDIPEITDFSKFVKNPFAGRFKNGYTIIVEHEDYDEVITITKSRREKQQNNAT